MTRTVNKNATRWQPIFHFEKKVICSWKRIISVYCTFDFLWDTKLENPKSSVIPRSLLCGFLSKQAVELMVLNCLARLVFPLSTCPRSPMLKFIIVYKYSFVWMKWQSWCKSKEFLSWLFVHEFCFLEKQLVEKRIAPRLIHTRKKDKKHAEEKKGRNKSIFEKLF